MVEDFVKSRKELTIAVDFDGVIHSYEKGWVDGKIYGQPNPGTVETLTRLQELGCKVIIYTTRAHSRIVFGKLENSQLQELYDWLKRYNIPYDWIHTDPGKPLAHLYIDDRGLRFTSWNEAFGQICDILNLEPK